MATTDASTKLIDQGAAEVLKAMADPTRLAILRYLASQPRSVTSIAESAGVPVVNASHHLGVLRNAGLVKSEKDGRFVMYSMNPNVFSAKGGDYGRVEIGGVQVTINEPGGTVKSSPRSRVAAPV